MLSYPQNLHFVYFLCVYCSLSFYSIIIYTYCICLHRPIWNHFDCQLLLHFDSNAISSTLSQNDYYQLLQHILFGFGNLINFCGVFALCLNSWIKASVHNSIFISHASFTKFSQSYNDCVPLWRCCPSFKFIRKLLYPTLPTFLMLYFQTFTEW